MVEVPALSPPKQKFPISFDAASTSNHRIGLGAPPPSWPGESANGERVTKPAWEIKNDSEVYVERLESKLNKIQSTHDSGYNSQSLDAARLDNANRLSFSEGEEYEEEEMESEGANDEVREFRDENEREGEGLLWENGQQTETPFSTSPVDTFTRIIPPTPSQHRPEPASSLAPERPAVSQRSSNESLVTHEAVSNTTTDEEDEEQDYIPTLEQEALNKESRRISFNASVRISGGIRSKSSRRALLESDLFSPVASTSTHRPRSRRASPQRTLSQSSHPRDASSSSLGPDGQVHSTTTSAFPSRSSSPCSSIYAPLQPSSQTCPSSAIFIRAPTTADVHRNRSEKKVESRIESLWNGSGSTLGSWRDYLLGTKGSGRNGLIGEEDAAKAAKGYRDLVAEQRQLRQNGHVRRASGTRRRSSISRSTDPPRPEPITEESGLLTRVWGLLKSGVVASGRGGSGFMIGTTYGSNLGSGSEGRNGGTEHVVEERSRTTSHRQPQRTRRSSSTLSISDLVSSAEEGTGFTSRQNSPTPAPPPAEPTVNTAPTASYLTLPILFSNPFSTTQQKEAAKPKPKSTADVIYGPAPGRWITRLWARDIVGRAVREVRARIGRCWNGEEEI